MLRLSKKDVGKEELAQAFGPMSNKNGWRYDHRLALQVTREVVELYCIMTSKKLLTMNLLYCLLGDSFLRVGALKSIGRPLLHIFILTERRCAL